MNALRLTAVVLGLVLYFSPPLQAAYLFEVDVDGMDDGVLVFNPNFSFGGDTTTASQSAPSSAVGTNGADSIFGGDGTALPDTYVSMYSPDSEPDNLVLALGTDLGEGNRATGVVGGGPGRYHVYYTQPFSSNISGPPTNWNVATGVDSFDVSLNTNSTGNTWTKLGEINYTSGPITVTQTPTSNTFVSQRLYGYLFEQVPEPTAVALGFLGAAGIACMTRRRRKSGAA